MARVTEQVKAVVRPRWNHWLRARMEDAGLDPRELGREIALRRGNDDPGGAYTKLVGDWLAERKTVSARLAFEVGEMLRARLPWCGGFLALGVCGYERERLALYAALDDADPVKAVWLAVAFVAKDHLAEVVENPRRYLQSPQPDLAREVLASAWSEIGGDALRRAWEAAATTSIRPGSVAAILEAILACDELEDRERDELLRMTMQISLETAGWFEASSEVADQAIALFAGPPVFLRHEAQTVPRAPALKTEIPG